MPLAVAIAFLTIICQKTGYYLAQFKDARTLAIKKLGKAKYNTIEAQRLITLLSIVGKVIKKATAQRIQDLVEKHNLLLRTQIGAKRSRLTTLALELLTKQVHTIWGSGKHVASLLSLDISGAFDIANYICLLDVLQKKGLLVQIV